MDVYDCGKLAARYLPCRINDAPYWQRTREVHLFKDSVLAGRKVLNEAGHLVREETIDASGTVQSFTDYDDSEDEPSGTPADAIRFPEWSEGEPIGHD